MTTARTRGSPSFPVGASLLAKVVNNNACLLAERGDLLSIASKLAPTGSKSNRVTDSFHFVYRR
ncbi:hypothetical protein EJA72_14010 [Pseudomonas sp. PB120]|nr:hypothetical protein [Pseudomonas sp. PB120]